MKYPKLTCILLVLLYGANHLSMANAYDIPPPGPAPKEKVLNEKETLEKNLQSDDALLKAKLKSFQIRIDKDATEAKLVIPVSILRGIQDNAKSSSDFTPRFFLDDQPILRSSFSTSRVKVPSRRLRMSPSSPTSLLP